MIRRFSLHEACPHIDDKKILSDILEKLREDFLFIPLDNFEIEVNEQDIEPIQRHLAIITEQLLRDRENNSSD